MSVPSVSIVLYLAVAGALIAPAAHAQFRWVAPDGTVTYGDRPPPSGAQAIAAIPTSPPAADAALPHALRTVASKFPVTLYSTDECRPCQQARSHLVARGIPFSERTIRNAADADAFRRAGFSGDGLPVLAVGRERSTGFEPGAWDRLLDAAGYPQSSMLPRGFRHSPAQSMAPPAAAPVAARDAAAAVEQPGADATAAEPASAAVADPRPEPGGSAPPLRF
jgi:hypothetical protein